MLKILAGCQDAGGYNAICSVVERLRKKGDKVTILASKSSIKMLKKKREEFLAIRKPSHRQLGKLLEKENIELVLLGTSIGYSLEDMLVEEAKKRGIYSIAILDAWMNYSARFSDLVTGERNKYLPDTVCVMDDIAKREMIKEKIPKDRIRVTGNPYYENFYKGVKPYSYERKQKILKRLGIDSGSKVISFFSQAINRTFGSSIKDKRYLGYTQYQALGLLIDSLLEFTRQKNHRISLIVRPHPKENDISFYRNLAKRTDAFRIIVDRKENFKSIIAISNIVAGMFSSALVEGYMLGKNILSIQPNLIVDNPLVLSRIKLVKSAGSEAELKRQLEAALSGKKKRKRIKTHFRQKSASSKIMEIIDEPRETK